MTDSITIERCVTTESLPEDEQIDAVAVGIRPKRFDDYPGQDNVKENLRVYVEAAKRQSRTLDHVILHGPPGLGKTTLAGILANELGVPFHSTSGPALDKPGDMAGILTQLESGAILFIDEIHRLSIKVEEILYSAMEDFQIDFIVGQGTSAKSVRVPVEPFTLIGATTRLSLLSKPLRERFGIDERLEYYDEKALTQILNRSAQILDIKLEKDATVEIARRARGTPRLANRLLKRVWDFAVYDHKDEIDLRIANSALERQGIDSKGLDRTDRMILKVIHEQYGGGPVGIDALAATINADRGTIEDVYEPYLVYRGFLGRRPKGRVLTKIGENHLTNS